jgi:hypothetical protein
MAQRVEVSERGVPADPGGGIDVDRADGEAELGIETGNIADEGISGIRRGVEDGLMNGSQLLPRWGMDPQPVVDLPEERLDLGRAPARVSDGPGIVIGAVPPDSGTAIVRGAPSYHPCSLQRHVRRPVAAGGGVFPGGLLDRHQRRIEQSLRPGSARRRAVVRPRLEEQHVLARLGQPRRDDGSRRSRPDHNRSRRPRQRSPHRVHHSRLRLRFDACAGMIRCSAASMTSRGCRQARHDILTAILLGL